MRTTTCVVAVLALACAGVSRAQSQPTKRIVYFSSDRARTVTMSRGGGSVVSFVVPVDTLMSVSFESQFEPNLMAKPFRAHGAVQIRMIRESERHGPQAEALLVAPVAVSGDGVDLVVADGR